MRDTLTTPDPGEERTEPLRDGWLLGAGLIALAILVATLVSPLSVTGFFHDDSFFYMKTAQNIADGQGSTFDGVNRTNGYHPLYMLLLIGCAAVVPLVGDAGIRAVVLLDSLLLAAALPFLERFLAASGVRRPLRLLALFGIVVGIGFYDLGVEGRLLLLAASALVFAVAGKATPLKSLDRGAWIAALLGALVCLVRVDAILFVGALFAGVALLERPPASARLLLRRLLVIAALSLPSLGVVAGFLLYNQLVFSHPTTVSSWLKMGWQSGLEAPLLSTPGLWARFYGALLVTACCVPVLARIRLRSRTPDERRGTAIAIGLGLYTVGYLIVLALLLRGGLNTWYFVLPLLGSVTCAACVTEYALVRGPRRPIGSPAVFRIAGVTVIAALLVALGTGIARKTDRWRRDQHALGQWIDRNLPADARIFQVDASGGIAYFSRRAVINGDGLINGWEYQRYLRAGRLRDYLDDTGVGWVVWDAYRGERPVRIPVPLWSEPSVELTFESPEVVARSGRMVLLELSR